MKDLEVGRLSWIIWVGPVQSQESLQAEEEVRAIQWEKDLICSCGFEDGEDCKPRNAEGGNGKGHPTESSL